MKTRNIVTLYYVMSALVALSVGFIMGTYSNFLRSANLDEFWVNMVNVCYFVTITICEIPTGLFADIFGRKGSFVISCFIEAISFAIYGFSRSFGGFVLAEVIGAIGKTFYSGAFDAWLVDSLKETGKKINLTKIFARKSIISRTSIIVSAIVGGWIGDYGLNLSFFASSFLFLISGILAMALMKETYFVRNKFSFIGGIKEIRDTWNKSIFFVKKDFDFKFILILSSVQMFAFSAPNMEWQKVFTNLGVSNSLNGTIAGLISISMIIGILLYKKLGQYFKEEKKQLIFAQVFTGICIALTVSFANIFPVVIFFLLHEVGRGASGPIMESYTQKCITSSKERATLSSFGSMMGHLGGALGLLVSGLIAKYAGITSAWIVSGIILISVVFLITGKKNK